MKPKFKNIKNKTFIWSPMISHVGTIRAAIGMAQSLAKYGKASVYLVNVFGEFDNYKNSRDFKLLNIFYKISFCKTGIFSKILIYTFTIFSIPYLIFYILKYKPKIIITCLVGYVPTMLKFLFRNLIVINSIQGYPKLNILRRFLWKNIYLKSDGLITMTNITKIKLQKEFAFQSSKIMKLDNPIISRKIRLMANESLEKDDLKYFNKKVFCSIGRLTRQKNYLELLEAFNNFSKIYEDMTNLLIIGEGEERLILEEFINKNNIKNCFLLGFKKNPYKYLSRSNLYISSSLWEEPGHTIIEAGYLNVPVLSSDCPNGPREIINDNVNGFKYSINNIGDFTNKLLEIENINKKKLHLIKYNMKKTISNFTEIKFYYKFCNYYNFFSKK
jgi:glycosyltransferase involved in cell wall biosynthesis